MNVIPIADLTTMDDAQLETICRKFRKIKSWKGDEFTSKHPLVFKFEPIDITTDSARHPDFNPDQPRFYVFEFYAEKSMQRLRSVLSKYIDDIDNFISHDPRSLALYFEPSEMGELANQTLYNAMKASFEIKISGWRRVGDTYKMIVSIHNFDFEKEAHAKIVYTKPCTCKCTCK